MLNFFNDLYNNLVRSVPMHWKMLICAVSVLLSLWCIVRFLKKSNDKMPIHYGYIVLLIIFVAIAILYAMP